MFLRRDNRGDTIIEVMISMTILGLVLGLGYSSSNNSLKVGREAQERSQASKLAESQLELIRTRLDNGFRDVVTASTFCMPFDGGAPVVLPPSLPGNDFNTDNLAGYPDACRRDLYHLGIRRTAIPIGASGAVTHEFQVTARWDGLQGRRHEVKMLYRLVDQ